jgi:AcrR family transcriptional regulator
MRTRKPRRESSRARERQILDAALSCFLQNGLHGTTIKDIRDASGASHGSVYHHFNGKDHLAVTIYVEGMQDYHASITAAAVPYDTAEGGIRAMIACHLNWVLNHRDMALYLARVGVTEIGDEAADEIVQTNRRFYESLYQWLRPFVDRGDVIRVSPDLYPSLIFGPSAHLARHWLSGRLHVDLKEVEGVFADAAWKLLSTTRTPRGNHRPETSPLW